MEELGVLFSSVPGIRLQNFVHVRQGSTSIQALAQGRFWSSLGVKTEKV